MSAPSCSIDTPAFGATAPPKDSPSASKSAVSKSDASKSDASKSDASKSDASNPNTSKPNTSKSDAPQPGVIGKLLAAIHSWRMSRQMRNLASDMDPHIMQDVGVPDWLVNESTVQRELCRLRNADYMRW